ncbi:MULTISPECIES: transcriptional regulator GcvA [Rhizobium]|uniref:Transcriptional regulator GcvA n=2 Tax=Rhizobium phaseoli TaxID=396 RepID=A0A7X6F027_9HYPH|nr:MULTISPECIES: transcriptional regulator GcvA [Rhizobium]MDE8760135.1 transcriptional regulator GcvA [Rhizobium sp. CBK13]MDK4725671.1 transcriptional regulator GcvA [Rhizobium phaseoli]NKE87650.1 transcriptional regulator GcvA [Rhizobium phaseoli]NKF10748.1 transcriptional regulator GcvA [Rhizobium phaseoli]PDS72263.1 transcriptional regulator GcvA [Rhizobium phaseoli]
MPDQLPPLQTLRAFEATARRLSMTMAAEELHLTHGAVSRQIKALEDHLGVQLFRRLTRKIELTEAGITFFGTVTRLLSELARVAEDIRRKNDTTRLVISAGVSFASKWLTPRLHRLMAHYPDFDVHLQVTDAPVDFASGDVDVALQYGTGSYPFAAAERIMNETVSPVCAPEYRDRMGGLATPADLAKCKLIHEIGMTTTWERWFAMMELPYPKTRGPGYSHGSMSIEAAIRGEGVALGRSVLVAEDLAQGRLVALFPKARLDVEWGYDLVYAIGTQDHPKLRAFQSWISGEVREFAANIQPAFVDAVP